MPRTLRPAGLVLTCAPKRELTDVDAARPANSHRGVFFKFSKSLAGTYQCRRVEHPGLSDFCFGSVRAGPGRSAMSAASVDILVVISDCQGVPLAVIRSRSSARSPFNLLSIPSTARYD